MYMNANNIVMKYTRYVNCKLYTNVSLSLLKCIEYVLVNEHTWPVWMQHPGYSDI